MNRWWMVVLMSAAAYLAYWLLSITRSVTP
jgi:hypothetical protein